jgi:hypothetical protein
VPTPAYVTAESIGDAFPQSAGRISSHIQGFCFRIADPNTDALRVALWDHVTNDSDVCRATAEFPVSCFTTQTEVDAMPLRVAGALFSDAITPPVQIPPAENAQ